LPAAVELGVRKLGEMVRAVDGGSDGGGLNKGAVTVASGAGSGHVGFVLAVLVVPHGIRCGLSNVDKQLRRGDDLDPFTRAFARFSCGERLARSCLAYRIVNVII